MPNKSKYEVKAMDDGSATIYIYGDIGEDFWAEESNDAKTVIDKVEAITATEIHARLFSYGGSVADAVAIHNAFKRHPAKIITHNDGVCMSAMSLIYMAGDERHAAENSLLMIHAPMIGTYGNAQEHRRQADMLDRYADAMNSCYTPSGKSKEEVASLLKDGEDHIYTAEEALSEGFTTDISEALQIAASALPDRFSLPAAWVAANQSNEDKPMPKQQDNMATNENVVADKVKEPVAQPEPVAAKAPSREEVLAQEQERRLGVRAVFKPFEDRDGVRAIMDTALDNTSVTVEQAREQVLNHLGAQSMPLAGDAKISVGETSSEKFVEAATRAVLARGGVEERERGNPFNGASFMDLARASLDTAGVNHRGLDKMEVVGAAMTHSMSDFPILFENVMHKTLLTAYRRREFSWRRFSKVGNLSDFRAHNRYRTGSFGNLDSKTENNEFKHKTLSDASKESIALGTKGNLINISREMIINDDMGGFIDLLQSMGYAASRTVESDVYAYLASNPTMSDGVALFHASHGNLAGSGSAPSMATIEAARVAMAQQKDLDDNDFLDLRPSLFLGGMSVGGEARTINDAQYDPDTSSKLQRPNKVRGLFSDIIDTPRISGAEWYTFADPMDAPVIEVGFLDGNEDPFLEVKEGFTQDGAVYKVRLDYGIAAIGFEGAYKNPGQ